MVPSALLLGIGDQHDREAQLSAYMRDQEGEWRRWGDNAAGLGCPFEVVSCDLFFHSGNWHNLPQATAALLLILIRVLRFSTYGMEMNCQADGGVPIVNKE